MQNILPRKNSPTSSEASATVIPSSQNAVISPGFSFPITFTTSNTLNSTLNFNPQQNNNGTSMTFTPQPNNGATFTAQVHQTVPQFIPTVIPSSPLAVPFSPILQGPIFATSQASLPQFHPIIINGQPATILNSVPNTLNPTGSISIVGPPSVGPGNVGQTFFPTSPQGMVSVPLTTQQIGSNTANLTMPNDVITPGNSPQKNQESIAPSNLTVSKSLLHPANPPKPSPSSSFVSVVNQGNSNSTCISANADNVKQTSESKPVEKNVKKVVIPEDPVGSNHSCTVIEQDDSEFVWEDYLQETGSAAVSPTAFKHVEYSLESGFVKGMKLEVPNKCHADTYWVASVVLTCGPLLRLRYDGYEEDSSSDFWCDLMTSEIHPIGWCAQNNRILQPPEAIKDKFDEWREFLVKSLTGARTAPSYLLDKTTGLTPIEQLKPGMLLEHQHPIHPQEVWFVRIIENVGGRLYLRFEGAETAVNDFWLFYLNHRLHPIGWAKMNSYKYRPPKEIFSDHNEEEWMTIIDKTLEEAEKIVLPLTIFKDQMEIPPHTFQKGWKLEALNPIIPTQICPATVVEVVDERYFVIEMDSVEDDESANRIQFSCYHGYKGIFPVKWCQKNGLKLTPPIGWEGTEFMWEKYLEKENVQAAPESCFEWNKTKHEFESGMKLECVNYENPNQICVATITKVTGPLLWVHLDNSLRISASHIERIDSHNLFPVGWCSSNSYQLKTPIKVKVINNVTSKRVAIVQPEMAENLTEEAYTQLKRGNQQGTSWCPKIYFNHTCYSGPYLSKNRIAMLPKYVGPGPINLVLKEVLSMLISVAYKSCHVLKELQLEDKPNSSMIQQSIKAKYKGKSYRAVVETCRSSEQLEEFCRDICAKLECCPFLISQHSYVDACPDNCLQVTKTKCTYYCGKKKKPGRPPMAQNNVENITKKPGKRGRKRKLPWLHGPQAQRARREAAEARRENQEDDKDSNSSGRTCDSGVTIGSEKGFKRKSSFLTSSLSSSSSAKRTYCHYVPPPSDIKTRGAKLPRYSFERRTHKKIMIPPYSSQKLKSHHKSKALLSSHQQVQKRVDDIKTELRKVETSGGHSNNISSNKSGLTGGPRLKLQSNPLTWKVEDVIRFIKGTDCAHLAKHFLEQEIDGQALLLLTLPTVQEHLDLKLGPAIKLCSHIEKLKVAFYQHYAK